MGEFLLALPPEAIGTIIESRLKRAQEALSNGYITEVQTIIDGLWANNFLPPHVAAINFEGSGKSMCIESPMKSFGKNSESEPKERTWSALQLQNYAAWLQLGNLKKI